MSQTTIRFTHRVNGTLTDVTSVVLSNSAGTLGVKRNDTDAAVVADGTAMTKVSTGIYEYTFTDPAAGLEYTAYVEWVYGGETYRVEKVVTAGNTADVSDLCSLAKAKEYLGISSSTYDEQLQDYITAASALICTYCETNFVSASYVEYLDGGERGRRFLKLKNRPVTEVSKLADDPVAVLEIQNTDTTTNQRATVSLSSTTLTLTRVASGVTSSSTLTIASYPTLALLEAAIKAVGNGWTATVASGYERFPASELKYTAGALSARQPNTATLYYFEESSGDWRMDEKAGTIELAGDWFPPGFQNIEVRYTAGYSTIPAVVEQACAAVVAGMFRTSQSDATLKSERIGDYSYTVSDTVASSAADILSAYAPDAAWMLAEYRAVKAAL